MVADVRESLEGRRYSWFFCFRHLVFRDSNGDGDVVVIVVENIEVRM